MEPNRNYAAPATLGQWKARASCQDTGHGSGQVHVHAEADGDEYGNVYGNVSLFVPLSLFLNVNLSPTDFPEEF